MTDEAALDVESVALRQVVQSRFPEGNLILSDPHRWPDPPEANSVDFKVGWWAALHMVATLGEQALNDFEIGITGKIADLAQDFIHLTGDEGEVAREDFAQIIPHLHALQQAVMAQAAARAHPGRYRALGDDLPELEDDGSLHR